MYVFRFFFLLSLVFNHMISIQQYAEFNNLNSFLLSMWFLFLSRCVSLCSFSGTMLYQCNVDILHYDVFGCRFFPCIFHAVFHSVVFVDVTHFLLPPHPPSAIRTFNFLSFLFVFYLGLVLSFSPIVHCLQIYYKVQRTNEILKNEHS